MALHGERFGSMTVAYRGVSNASGENNGTTTTAGTAAITTTLPSGTVAGDRVFVIDCASFTSAAPPAGWAVIGPQNVIVGSGVVAAGSGQRYMNIYYRDYD